MAGPLIIDTDTHVTEPPDLWTSRLPSSWGDSVMHVRWDDEHQADVWVVGDEIIGRTWGLLAYGSRHVAGSEADRPKTRNDVHPATWDQAERVKVMDSIGIRTAVLYPNYGGLSARRFINMKSLEIAEAHLRAYNDYQLEWANNFPGRFVPMLVIPFWDLPGAVTEIERMAGKGFGGIVTTGAPQIHGQPLIADPHWNPLWQACVDANLSVSFHIGSGNSNAPSAMLESLMPPATHLAYTAVPAMLENSRFLLDLLLSGVLVRYPTLKFASVESGLGWVPFVLEAADYHFKKARNELRDHPWGDLLPSDLFRRQVYVNFWFEHLQPSLVEAVGVDNILFETDFPHRTCLEKEDVDQVLAEMYANLQPDVCEKILWRNAADLYSLPAVVGN
jgi:uncharacterized protein